MEMPPNSLVEIRVSPLKEVLGLKAQLKCIYTTAHSTGNNQEGLEAIVQQENCICHHAGMAHTAGVCSGWMAGNPAGGRGRGAALYVWDCSF